MRRIITLLPLCAALAGLAGCGDDAAGEMAGAGKPGAAPLSAEKVPALPPRPKAMSEAERIDALALDVIAAAPLEGAKDNRWKFVVRLKNATDVDLEGVEVRAAVFPPGTLTPIGMHAREVYFKEKLGYLKEELIELEFATAKSEAKPEEIRHEVKVVALVSPPVADTSWRVLDEDEVVMVSQAQPPVVDPQAEASKLRAHLASRATDEAQKREDDSTGEGQPREKRG